jgi:hypothetical protein
MKSSKRSSLSFILLWLTGMAVMSCGKPPATTDTTPPIVIGLNKIRMSVSNTLDCSASTNYINKPCVTLTICNVSGSPCTSVKDILVDTGSYGLRIFGSALPGVTPTRILTGGKNLSECVEYGDGSKQWGTVGRAQVKLGNETPVTVPMQIIDANATGMSANCSGAVTSPSQAGLNGILGIGVFAQDCGQGCVTNANIGYYYACDTSSCTPTTVALSDQVTNPVTALSQDNNGVVLMIPDIPFGGAASTVGYLVLGVATQENNTPASVTTFKVDPSLGEFKTTFNGNTYHSFLDSGSNGLFFPTPGGSLVDCTGAGESGWFCPTSTATLNAVNLAYPYTGSSVQQNVQFQIENFDTFWNIPSYYVGKEIGGNSGGNLSSLFDWGLPFHFGKNVYVGFEGKSSSLASGPYWAY